MTDVIPNNLEAEEHCLGACLMSQTAAEKVVAGLEEDCFFFERNARMFRVVADMVNSGIPVDVVTVTSAMKDERVRVHELIALTPATANIHHYIRLVREAWKKRLVLRAATKIVNEIEVMSADDAVASLDNASLEIEQRVDERHELVVDIKDLVAAKRYAMTHPQSVKAGVPTPFGFIPEMIGGRLYVLGGYQGGGKSALALQFAEAAAKAGEDVGFASVEMSKQDLFDRWACQRTRLPYSKVREPWLLNLHEQERLESSLADMEMWRVRVIDDEFLDPGKLRRYQRANKHSLLIVDHLHRMRWKDRHDLENQIRALTNIAREFEVPVILLAQLARAGDYAKPFPVPSMRQLRETAMLEAEASAVWFVYREMDESHVPTSQTQFIVAKNRYGRTGTHLLHFDDSSQTFTEKDWESLCDTEEPVANGLLAF